MQRKYAPRSFFALLTAAILALPVTVVPASAAPAPTTHVDDDVTQRLQSTPESQLIPVIIEGAAAGGASSSARAQRAETSVRNGGGRVRASSSLLGATVADLTSAQIRTLSADPAISHIHFDAPVQASATNDGSSSVSGSTPITFDQTIGATEAWKAGDTGRGVTVAVLDTGIDNNASAFGTRVTARVDLVDPLHPVQGDPAGHGTHVAGIVGASRSFPSPGVAPDASLVSVRVLDEQGQAHVSTVIAGLEWTIAHKAALGIRVVIMALGAPATVSYREDPLAAAAEIAWRSGLVVVVAAGNTGPAAGSISSPGDHPLLLTVGATDESGTPSTADDVIPTWSSQGPTLDGLAKPDLVAPGRKIVSVRVPGSTLDRLLPTHIEGPQTFRLSGTSEATAVGAGAVALLLQHRERLHPDQVKAILTHSTNHLAGTTPNAAGSGEIDVARALVTPVPAHAKQTVRPSDALIELLEAIGRAALGEAQDVEEEQANGDHVNWDHVNWDHVNWDHVNWDHVNWDHVNWDHVNWDHVNWDHVNWDHVNWDHVNWDHVNWDHVNWDHVNWDHVNWD
jgi:serine protease AprX